MTSTHRIATAGRPTGRPSRLLLACLAAAGAFGALGSGAANAFELDTGNSELKATLNKQPISTN